MQGQMVLLHGFTGSPQSFDAMQLPRAVGVRLMGHGPDPVLGIASYDEEVSRIASLIASGSEPVDLVGYSMGARVALGMALKRPELVGRLSLIGVNPGLSSEQERQERLAWESRWIDTLEVDGLAVFEHKWRALPLFSSQASLPPQALEEQRRQRLSHTAHGLARAMEVLGLGSMPDLWPQLQDLKPEVQLVVGGSDHKFRAIAHKFKRLAKQAKVVELDGVGHNPLLEAPNALRSVLLGSPLPPILRP